MSSLEESFSEKEKPIRTLNVFLSIRSRIPESTSYTPYSERRLRRMVCKNGGKFERFTKIIKKSSLVQIAKFFRRSYFNKV